MASLAERMGFPRLLVDLRHESTHSSLPSLPTLRRGAALALEWVRASYWERQSKALADSVSQARALFQEYSEAFYTRGNLNKNVEEDEDSEPSASAASGGGANNRTQVSVTMCIQY